MKLSKCNDNGAGRLEDQLCSFCSGHMVTGEDEDNQPVLYYTWITASGKSFIKLLHI